MQISGDDNKVQANYIGTNPLPAHDNLGNGYYGVYVDGSQNVIGAPVGSDDATLGNWIAFSGQQVKMRGDGVAVVGDDSTGDTIRLDHIFKNERLGIDLGDDYFDRYDPTKFGTGANGHQWHPTIIGVDPTAGTITWMLNAQPKTQYTIDVYYDPRNGFSDYAEGEIQAADPIVQTTDGTGHVEFTTSVGHTEKITATATDSQGNTSEFSLADADADGLCDTWEVPNPNTGGVGIDLDGDGTLDLQFPTNDLPNLRCKDVYVEVDSMTGYAPVGGSLDWAESVFEAHDINLHAERSDEAIDPAVFGDIAKSHFSMDDFHNYKAAWFADHHGPNSLAYQAKLLAYHYCIFGVAFEEPPHPDAHPPSPEHHQGSSGRGEILGNDFMVTLGGWWDDKTHHNVTAAQEEMKSPAAHDLVVMQQTGTFLHELGHNLGLRHTGTENWNESTPRSTPDGGPQSTELDPAYHSVMNYDYQAPGGSGYLYQIIHYSEGSPNEWNNLWFAFQEAREGYANGDAESAPDDDVDDNYMPTLDPSVDDLVPIIYPPLDSPVATGAIVPLTFSVVNLGPATAAGSSFTLTLPAGFLVGTVSVSQGTVGVSGNTITASFGDVASFDGATLTVNLTPLQVGTFTLTGIAASTTTDGCRTTTPPRWTSTPCRATTSAMRRTRIIRCRPATGHGTRLCRACSWARALIANPTGNPAPRPRATTSTRRLVPTTRMAWCS